MRCFGWLAFAVLSAIGGAITGVMLPVVLYVGLALMIAMESSDPQALVAVGMVAFYLGVPTAFVGSVIGAIVGLLMTAALAVYCWFESE